VIDTRRYQWMIGGFGLTLLIAFSLYLFARGGAAATPGVQAGRSLHRFVAPLATSGLDAAANVNPRCDPARPARRGLNVCGREPIVLAFFVLGARPCERAVDALQRVSTGYPGIEFAAVAVGSARGPTATLVRRNRWSIPVAYDLTGSVGALYGVSVCPMIELARRGGVVEQRLIGDRWGHAGALAARVRVFAAGSGIDAAPPEPR